MSTPTKVLDPVSAKIKAETKTSPSNPPITDKTGIGMGGKEQIPVKDPLPDDRVASPVGAPVLVLAPIVHMASDGRELTPAEVDALAEANKVDPALTPEQIAENEAYKVAFPATSKYPAHSGQKPVASPALPSPQWASLTPTMVNAATPDEQAKWVEYLTEISGGSPSHVLISMGPVEGQKELTRLEYDRKTRLGVYYTSPIPTFQEWKDRPIPKPSAPTRPMEDSEEFPESVKRLVEEAWQLEVAHHRLRMDKVDLENRKLALLHQQETALAEAREKAERDVLAMFTPQLERVDSQHVATSGGVLQAGLLLSRAMTRANMAKVQWREQEAERQREEAMRTRRSAMATELQGLITLRSGDLTRLSGVQEEVAVVYKQWGTKTAATLPHQWPADLRLQCMNTVVKRARECREYFDQVVSQCQGAILLAENYLKHGQGDLAQIKESLSRSYTHAGAGMVHMDINQIMAVVDALGVGENVGHEHASPPHAGINSARPSPAEAVAFVMGKEDTNVASPTTTVETADSQSVYSA